MVLPLRVTSGGVLVTLTSQTMLGKGGTVTLCISTPAMTEWKGGGGGVKAGKTTHK